MKSVNRISISRGQEPEQARAPASLLVAVLFQVPLALGTVTYAHAFEGRVTAALTRGGETQTFTYTVGTTTLRIERNETDRPHPGNLVALETGTVEGCLSSGIFIGGLIGSVVESCRVNIAGSYGIGAHTILNSTAIWHTGLSADMAENCYGVSSGSGTGLRAFSIAIGSYGRNYSYATGLDSCIANSSRGVSLSGTSLVFSFKYNMQQETEDSVFALLMRKPTPHNPPNHENTSRLPNVCLAGDPNSIAARRLDHQSHQQVCLRRERGVDQLPA